MKNMKYKTTLLAYVLVVALFFAIGYGAGVINGQNRAREEISAAATIAPDAVNASVTAEDEEREEYMLVLDGGALAVYENGGSERRKLTECEISETVYPPEDIAALKAGMIFSSRGEAMEMFENFAS